jgi:hypothetical protein
MYEQTVDDKVHYFIHASQLKYKDSLACRNYMKCSKNGVACAKKCVSSLDLSEWFFIKS